MIKTVSCLVLTCDRCGDDWAEDADHEDNWHMEDLAEVEKHTTGWRMVDGQPSTCPGCTRVEECAERGHDPGEWVTKSFPTRDGGTFRTTSRECQHCGQRERAEKVDNTVD